MFPSRRLKILRYALDNQQFRQYLPIVLLGTVVIGLYFEHPMVRLSGAVLLFVLVFGKQYIVRWAHSARRIRPSAKVEQEGGDDDGGNSSYAGLYDAICDGNFKFPEELTESQATRLKKLAAKKYDGGSGGGRRFRPMTAAQQAQATAAMAESGDSAPPAPSPFSSGMGR